MYSKGKLNGPQKTYYENGKIETLTPYKNNKTMNVRILYIIIFI